MSGEFYGREPHDAYAWMRANAPVYYDEANDLWAAASYAAVKQASVDTESFSNAAGHPAQVPAAADDDRLRRARARAPAPARLRGLHPQAGPGDGGQAPRWSATPSSTQVCERGSCDFVGRHRGAAAHHRDRRHARRRPRGPRRPAAVVRRHAQGARARPTPTPWTSAMNAFVGYTEYIHPVLADRRATGQHRRPRRRAVPRRDRRRLARRRLARPRDAAHPDRRRRDDAPRHQRRRGGAAGPPRPAGAAGRRPRRADAGRGRGDAALGVADQEHGPHGDPRRRAGGRAASSAGQELLLLYPSANRDEAVFDDPDTFDITRSPNPHMAFGFGAHFCLGNQLARLELRVMVERLLARLPDLHLAVERGPLPRRKANFISGIEEMPVEFTPTAPAGRRPRLMAGRRRRAGIAGWSILVTGGGSGIGLATAERLAADGAHVTICGRTEQKLADATARIAAAAAGGATARYVVADVTVEDQVAAAVAATAEATGRIDGLFACAGGSTPPRLGPHRRRGGGAGHHRPQPDGLGHLREAGRRSPCRPQGGPRRHRAHVLGRGALPAPAPVGLRRGEGRHLLPGRDGGRGARPARHPRQRGGARASSTTS